MKGQYCNWGKWLVFLALAGILLLPLSSWSAPDRAEGNGKTGLKRYRTGCLSCHPKGPLDGPAGAQSRTAGQWERFFRRHRHPQLAAWTAIPEEDMVNIRRYLLDHAVGTDQDKCGACWVR